MRLFSLRANNPCQRKWSRETYFKYPNEKALREEALEFAKTSLHGSKRGETDKEKALLFPVERLTGSQAAVRLAKLNI